MKKGGRSLTAVKIRLEHPLLYVPRLTELNPLFVLDESVDAIVLPVVGTGGN